MKAPFGLGRVDHERPLSERNVRSSARTNRAARIMSVAACKSQDLFKQR